MFSYFDHSYWRLLDYPVNLVTFIFEYTTLEFGTYFLILSGFPLSAGHGPFWAHGYVDPGGYTPSNHNIWAGL